MKFTNKDGRVGLTCTPWEDQIAVSVSDTGVGIPLDMLALIFEPFVQVDPSLTRKRDGTGLGLAISRQLARAMGGDLTAESTIGVGSTFTLTLPAARVEAGGATIAASAESAALGHAVARGAETTINASRNPRAGESPSPIWGPVRACRGSALSSEWCGASIEKVDSDPCGLT